MARKKIIADANDLMASLDNSAISSVLIDDLNKKYGQVAYALGEEQTPTDLSELVSTGCTVLDSIISNDLHMKLGLDNGGLPVGRLVEIFGDNQTGKSLLANHVLINTQKLGGVPILFDEENGTSIEFLRRMGMKIGPEARNAGLNNLVYLQIGSVEGVFEAMESIINKVRDLNSDKLITIVWDSIASTPTKEEIEKGFDEYTMAVKARALSLGLRKIMSLIGKKRVLLLFTNQIRSKFGVMFGDPTTTPGGYAPKFHSSVRIQLYKTWVIKDDKGNPIGAGVKAKIAKNRVSSPGRECQFSVYFKKGVDDLESNFNTLVALEIVRKPTTMSYELDFNGQILKFRTTQWRENVTNTPGLEEFLRKQVMEKNILNFDEVKVDVDDLGNAKLKEDNEVEL